MLHLGENRAKGRNRNGESNSSSKSPETDNLTCSQVREGCASNTDSVHSTVSQRLCQQKLRVRLSCCSRRRMKTRGQA